jgi:hypothetical protein
VPLRRNAVIFSLAFAPMSVFRCRFADAITPFSGFSMILHYFAIADATLFSRHY